MSKYFYEMDDPYKILAHAIVGFHRPADVFRILNDDHYLLMLITKEVRAQDMSGRFVDCIVEDILEQKSRMEYMHELDRLAKYYWSKLDKPRLRSEILLVLDEAGIVLDDYSAGRVSDAST